MRALITRMDQPLGRAVGNAVEVAECVECLRGRPKGRAPRTCSTCPSSWRPRWSSWAGGPRHSKTPERCAGGRSPTAGLWTASATVQAQGGDPRALDDPDRLPAARRKIVLKSTPHGVVQGLAARPIGQATMLLGAGRARMDSRIDPAVGVFLHKKVGSAVEVEEPLCTLFVNDESRLEEAMTLIKGSFRLGAENVAPPSLVVERIASGPAGSLLPRPSAA